MTTFNTADIPASIDTYEKLGAWVGLVLNAVNPDLTVVEGPGTPERAAQFGTFKVDQTQKTHAFVRLSLELETDFAYYDGPLYDRIKNLSTTAVPAALKA